MKKLITTLLLFSIFNVGFSQVYKWRSSVFSSRFTTSTDIWSDWTAWTTSGVLITADPNNQRVKVFSATPQTYDMIESVSKNTDNSGNSIYSVMCVDENATRCKMIWYHTQQDGSFVIFQFSNLELMYKVIPLDN